MSVRYKWGATRITSLAAAQWGNRDGDPNATSLPIEPGPVGSSLGEMCSAPARRQDGFATVACNLLLTTLAVVVAADTSVLRTPTYQQGKTKPAVTVVQPPNLLTSTLSVAVAPAPFVPLQQAGLQRIPWLPDATQKQPLTLRVVVATAPTVSAVHFSPVRFFWQPPDESAGTPKTLTQDAQLPFQVLAQTAPDRLRPVTDTTQKQPTTLQVIVPPAPTVSAVHFPPVKNFWQPADTSEGVPKTLTFDAQLPFQTLAYTVPDRIRPVTDTTRGQPITLQVIVPPAPFVNPPHFAPTKFFWQPQDVSRGTPKGFIPDAQLPFRVLAQTAPDRIRPVVNTSQSSYGTTHPVVILPLPPGKTVFLSPQRYMWQVVNTSYRYAQLPASVVSEKAYTFIGFTFITG